MSQRRETAYKAEPQGESAQHDEAHPDLWGMVNAAVVQGKIMLLPGEICPTVRPPFGGSAPCSNAWGDWAEVSRRHSSGFLTDEAKA